MQNLSRLDQAETFVFSPENPFGRKEGGSRGRPWEKLSPNIAVAPGATITLADMEGPGMISSMWFGGYTGWNFILRVYWDDQTHPSVETPLCAFFGYGYYDAFEDANGSFPLLNSAVVLAAPCQGMNAYWPMPFRRRCRITLENRSQRDTRHTFYAITAQKTDVEADCGYFHAAYRQEKPVAQNRAYTVIDGVSGMGKYVGMTLFVGVNGNNGCWVEGEAKMYLDGDAFPSINYTGTEDYFGGSFAFGYDAEPKRYLPYSGLYAGMHAVLGDARTPYNYQPRFMLYRWHIPDPIHFSTDFRMTLQNLGNFSDGMRTRRDDYASVACWYQTLPSRPLAPLPSDEAVDMQ